MRRVLVVAFLIILGGAAPLQAADTPATPAPPRAALSERPITVDEAVAIALEYQPNILARVGDENITVEDVARRAEEFQRARGQQIPPGMMPQRFSGSDAEIVMSAPSAAVLRTSRSRSTAPGSANCSPDSPATNSWSSTGPMNEGRFASTSTLLAGGSVLVTGGYNYGSVLASAELFNAATGTWTLTTQMSTQRSHHTASLLPNGRIMVSGGWNFGGRLASGADRFCHARHSEGGHL